MFSLIFFSGEYGGWQEALDAGDPEAVWVTAQPLKIPMHNFYEFIWFLKTGGPRLVRVEVTLYGFPELDLFYMVSNTKVFQCWFFRGENECLIGRRQDRRK